MINKVNIPPSTSPGVTHAPLGTWAIPLGVYTSLIPVYPECTVPIAAKNA